MKNQDRLKVIVGTAAFVLTFYVLFLTVNNTRSNKPGIPVASSPSVEIIRQLARTGRETQLKEFADASHDVKLGILQSAPFLELRRDNAMVTYIQGELKDLAKTYKTEDVDRVARLMFIGWGEIYSGGRPEKPIGIISNMQSANEGLYEEFTLPEDLKANMDVFVPKYLATPNGDTMPAVEATQEFALARRIERAKAAGKYITPTP